MAIRLMTANLLNTRGDAADFARVLERVEPDVIVTQELGPECADVLVGAFRNHMVRPALDYTGRGIGSNLDIETGDIVMPGRNGTSAVIDVAGHDVRLAGVHLLNPINFPWWVQAKQRGEQLGSVLRWLDSGNGPVVVVGDFNASPRWPAYKSMASRLDDLVAQWARARGQRPERTWAWRPGLPRMLRIDHVFGAGLYATEVRVVPIKGSDHAAVVVDLEMNNLGV